MVNLTGNTYLFTPLATIPAPVQPPYVNIGDPVIKIVGQTIVITYTCDAASDMTAALDLVTVNPPPSVKGIYGEQKKT